MHIAIRLSDEPLRLYGDVADPAGHAVGTAVVGGARASFYIRDAVTPARSVGALLRPGASLALFGVEAGELARRHTPLEDLWGPSTASIREQLVDLASLEERLDFFEAYLAAHLRRPRALHPAIAEALETLDTGRRVHEAVGRTGYSHRTFIAHFRRAVGLTPKLYGRVRRFSQVLKRLTGGRPAPLLDAAIEAGYSDQAHFNRNFREFAGATPTAYRDASPKDAHHLPATVPEPGEVPSSSFKT